MFACVWKFSSVYLIPHALPWSICLALNGKKMFSFCSRCRLIWADSHKSRAIPQIYPQASVSLYNRSKVNCFSCNVFCGLPGKPTFSCVTWRFEVIHVCSLLQAWAVTLSLSEEEMYEEETHCDLCSHWIMKLTVSLKLLCMYGYILNIFTASRQVKVVHILTHLVNHLGICFKSGFPIFLS